MFSVVVAASAVLEFEEWVGSEFDVIASATAELSVARRATTVFSGSTTIVPPFPSLENVQVELV
jgi:hypothetical protein